MAGKSISPLNLIILYNDQNLNIDDMSGENLEIAINYLHLKMCGISFTCFFIDFQESFSLKCAVHEENRCSSLCNVIEKLHLEVVQSKSITIDLSFFPTRSKASFF